MILTLPPPRRLQNNIQDKKGTLCPRDSGTRGDMYVMICLLSWIPNSLLLYSRQGWLLCWFQYSSPAGNKNTQPSPSWQQRTPRPPDGAWRNLRLPDTKNHRARRHHRRLDSLLRCCCWSPVLMTARPAQQQQQHHHDREVLVACRARNLRSDDRG